MRKAVLASLALTTVFIACDNGSSNISTSTNGRSGEDAVFIEDGVFVDGRDGNSYKVVLIDDVYWMAENLRYADSTQMKHLKNNVKCYDNKSSNCEKYGALYTWSAALDEVDTIANKKYLKSDDRNVRGICPDGWYLPSFAQWKDLFDYVTNNSGVDANGTSLKSISGWDEVDSVPASTNRFGFNVLASGRYNSEGGFLPDGKNAYFWSSTEVDASTAKGVSFRHTKLYADHGEYYKDHGMSVRCVTTQTYLSKNNGEKITVKGDLDSSYIKEIPFDYGSVKIDSKSYKTINIGGRVWMAENLNYKTGDSWCYSDSDENCDKFGRLYNWSSAQNVCPEGWLLPTWNDMKALLSYHKENRFFRSTEGWKEGSAQGLNFWGFNALPAGAYNEENTSYYDMTRSAYFWTSDEYSSDTGMGYALYISDADKAEVKYFEKQHGFSVRCVKE